MSLKTMAEKNELFHLTDIGAYQIPSNHMFEHPLQIQLKHVPVCAVIKVAGVGQKTRAAVRRLKQKISSLISKQESYFMPLPVRWEDRVLLCNFLTGDD